MSNVTNTDPVVTESKLTEFYQDIKPFLGCPAYVTQEGDEQYYSTDEKVIGRWLDGRPIYQKGFILMNIVADTENKVLIASSDIDNLIGQTGHLEWTSNHTHQIAFPYWGNTNSQAYIVLDETNNGYLTLFTKGCGACSITCSAQYTKKSDSAATTIETKPTHYSTDEQVVGYWIDSKPVYQKTFRVPKGSSQSFRYAHNIANLGEVVNSYGFMHVPDNAPDHQGIRYPLVFVVGGSGTAVSQWYSGFSITNTDIFCEIGSEFYRLISELYVTIQYTKSSD